MNHMKALNAVRAVGSLLLIIGIMTTILGLFVSNNSIMAAVGIGTVSGAVVIFLMGVFFVATDEMIAEPDRG